MSEKSYNPSQLGGDAFRGDDHYLPGIRVFGKVKAGDIPQFLDSTGRVVGTTVPQIPGKDGTSPHIGANGNWFVGDFDTGVKAAGTSPNIGANGNWFVGDVDTGVRAQGEKGEQGEKGDPGMDGETPDVSDFKNHLANKDNPHAVTAAQIGTAIFARGSILPDANSVDARLAVTQADVSFFKISLALYEKAPRQLVPGEPVEYFWQFLGEVVDNSKQPLVNVVKDASSTDIVLSPQGNSLYRYGTLSSLTVAALGDFDDEYAIVFTAGAAFRFDNTAFDGNWGGDNQEPEFVTGVQYEISVQFGTALIVGRGV